MSIQPVALIKKWWLEAIGWTFIIGYMTYIWLYYSWQAFAINVLFGVFGFMATHWFGHMMPFVNRWFDK